MVRSLAVKRHVAYFRRCLSLLPYPYTAVDSSRLALVFFAISALDILGALNPTTNGGQQQQQQEEEAGTVTAEEIANWTEWIYSACLLPTRDAFRCSPATNAGPRDNDDNDDNADYDAGHVAGTYFALGALLVLRDDLGRIDRAGMMRWLRRCQRPDGSFAAGVIGGFDHDRREREHEWFGERDQRFNYCAAAIRHIISKSTSSAASDDDIDVSAVRAYVLSCVGYDGGIGFTPSGFAESHAGLTYCGVATLRLLGDNVLAESMPRLPGLLRWLLAHQVAQVNDNDDDSDDDDDVVVAGFNGRLNKQVDTCYSFWVGGTLALLPANSSSFSHTGLMGLSQVRPNVRYLLSKTQDELTGGFAKVQGDRSDVLHSCLALTSLGLCADVIRAVGNNDKCDNDMDQDIKAIIGLKSIDAGLCVTQATRDYCEQLRQAWTTNAHFVNT
ncbi:terpenoid cyclases/protein prenyltransferase alpha-alpha toroid [Lipomyces japonicus]|uniref:terpenoid cyclases/protein prenyltransferase alpha-alpha toroid n=1 Tax=Lipomyces japonicus TaxID=56871 RepID=UPI0034CDE2F8